MHNAQLHKVQHKIRVLQGDVFEPLKKEKFDTIFWNTPWGLVKEVNLTPIEKALWDTEYRSTIKFIQEARNHLNKNGRLLIGFSSTIGDLDYLKRILKDNHFKAKIIKETTSQSVDFLAKFEIIEARLVRKWRNKMT
jgi:methylase of polypeptide subunit release factors